MKPIHKKIVAIVFVVIIATSLYVVKKDVVPVSEAKDHQMWSVQAIDTMKYSRDIAREKLNDESYTQVINQQVSDIAKTGATHVAIGTPYEAEFVPFMARWIKAARAEGLHVWFRGNAAGWEGWFGYPKITREQHTQHVVNFIKSNPQLFEDNDIFSSCPECENGGPGDPRETGDVAAYRTFLKSQHIAVNEAFSSIGKSVMTSFYSMNGDVARLVMDKETTAALGGFITVDHYVKSPKKLADDIRAYAELSGGKVVLGEWGAPIPDIHGKMDADAQNAWIQEALKELSSIPSLYGVNYWTAAGSSTQLWEDDGEPKLAVSTITKYYNLKTMKGTVVNEIDTPVAYANVQSGFETVQTDLLGEYAVTLHPDDTEITISGESYAQTLVSVANLENAAADQRIVLIKTQENILFRFAKLLRKLLPTN